MSERELFEESAARMGYNLTMAEHETGEYRYPVTQDAWNMWQECCDKAARQAPASGELVDLAKRFHSAYERLAPEYGYKTREDTKVFDPDTPNGKLMTAVMSEIYTHPPAKVSESVILRKQAEAVDESLSRYDPAGYADSLRQQADELERG